jgi:uncharacterized protein YciI
MLFIVFLRFSANRGVAHRWMAAHSEWVRRGIDEGIFLVVGSLEQGAGGAVVAVGASIDALRARLAEDPFVAHRVVEAEIVPVKPSQTSPRLGDLLAALGRPGRAA